MSDWLHTVLVQTKAEQEERAQEMAEKTGKPLANCRPEYVLDHPASIRSAFACAIERAGLAPDGMADEATAKPPTQIGRPSYRERVCTTVCTPVVEVPYKK